MKIYVVIWKGEHGSDFEYCGCFASSEAAADFIETYPPQRRDNYLVIEEELDLDKVCAVDTAAVKITANQP